jgi:predicted N-acetyltransferase YhbS
LRLFAPVPLHAEHRLDEFRCRVPALEKWLRERALPNQSSGASRCFVACDEQNQVIGYHALSAGSIAHEAASARLRRNMPDPIPVIVLARLAVHMDWTAQGIGQGLLKDAVLRALQAGDQIGARALLCHAIDAPATAFYVKHGFIASPVQPMTMFLPLTHAR